MTEFGAKPTFTRWAPWFIPAFVVVLVFDQLTKFLIFRADPDWIGQSGWLAQHYNTGVAWSIGDSMPAVVTLITMLLIPILCWVWWRQFRLQGRSENLAFGAVLGGAIGNAIDRVLTQFGQMQGVRDFIAIDLNIIGINYHWPTFNIADAGICCGVILLVILSFVKTPASPSTDAKALV